MVLARYIFKRYFLYFSAVTIFLALLSNFVEFFEKLIRVKHAGILTILHFVTLNFLPSIFEYMPIASWLVTCLLIKELQQQHEWEILQILSVSYKKLCSVFLLIGFVLAGISFIGKEYISVSLAFKSERFKQQTFKQSAVQKIINKWILLDQNSILHIGLIDVENNKGSDLLLITMSQDFKIEKTLSAEHFELDPKKQRVIIADGKMYSVADGSYSKIQEEKFLMPGLFSQIQINLEMPSLLNIIKHLIFDKAYLPASLHSELLYQFLKRFFAHFQLILYPLLTFFLFAIFSYLGTFQWIAILSLYPVMILATAVTDSLARASFTPWIALLPLLIMALLTLLCRVRLR